MEKVTKSFIRNDVNKCQIDNTLISMYIPKKVKEEIVQYCREKDIEMSRWIRRLVINELEKHMHKRYNYKLKEFVKFEEKSKKKLS